MNDFDMNDIDFQVSRKGETVDVTVIQVLPTTITVAINKSNEEARMHLEYYSKPMLDSFVGVLKIGDVFKAKVIRKSDEDDSTLILLSRLPLLEKEIAENIEKMVENHEMVLAKVTGVDKNNKGLLLNYSGLEIFIPDGLLDREYVESKPSLRGQELLVELTELKVNRGRISLKGSRKAVFSEARQKEREERLALNSLKTEERAKKIAEFEKQKQEDLENREKEIASINTGDILDGEVIKIEDHSATIKFKYAIGLVRISQVSHHHITKVEDVLKLNEQVKVKVIRREGNRIDLSIKALLKTPIELFSETHKVGEKITGKIVQKLPFGLIIEVEPDVRGLLHKNEYSWNPNDNFDMSVKIDDKIETTILKIEVLANKIALSKKALDDNPWKNVVAKRNDSIEVKVIEANMDGLLVEAQGVNVVIKNQDLGIEKGHKAQDYFAKNDVLTAKVLDVNIGEWSLKLSIKAIKEQEERESFEKHIEKENVDASLNLGDFFKDDLKK